MKVKFDFLMSSIWLLYGIGLISSYIIPLYETTESERIITGLLCLILGKLFLDNIGE